ncbi:B-box type zinc finger protein ncl-1-like [Haemaphysalis longicornis]
MESNNEDSSSEDEYPTSARESPEPSPRCSLCQTTSSSARPLDCSHGFCIPCLLEIYTGGAIHCPLCQRGSDDQPERPATPPSEYDVPSSPGAGARDGATLRCTSCNSEQNSAVARCFDCADLLCINCAMAHYFMRFFESHRFVPLEEQQPAHSHPRPAMSTSLCGCCNRPLCEVCALRQEQRRAAHRPAPPPTPRRTETPPSDLGHWRGQRLDLEAALRALRHMAAGLEAQYGRARERVDDAYEFYLSVLEERRQAVVDDLDSAYEASMTALERNRQREERRASGMAHLRTILGALLQDAEARALDEWIETHFQEMLAVQQEGHPVSTNVEFVSNHQAIPVVVANTFGYVDGGEDSEQDPQHPPVAVAASGPAQHGSTRHENDRSAPVRPPGLFGSSLPSNYLNPAELPSGSGDAPRDVVDRDLQGACAPPLPNARSETLNLLVERQKMTYFCTLGDFGGAVEAPFTEPSGVAVTDNNDIVVADSHNQCIQIFDRQCRFKRQFGEYGNRDGQLLYPNRVAVAPRTGDIVVTERSPAHQIQVYTRDGQFVRQFGATILQHPRGIAVDNRGRMVVVESKVMRITVFDPTGCVLRKFRCCDHLDFPIGVAVNDREEVFIADNRAHCVKVFSYDGAFVRQIGGEGITDYPIAVCINERGEVVVADNHNNFHITVFTQDGRLVNALESMTKHAQCSDIALMDDGSVVLASKDNRLYVYRYVQPSASFRSRLDSL